jgi:hypothetical protein
MPGTRHMEDCNLNADCIREDIIGCCQPAMFGILSFTLCFTSDTLHQRVTGMKLLTKSWNFKLNQNW